MLTSVKLWGSVMVIIILCFKYTYIYIYTYLYVCILKYRWAPSLTTHATCAGESPASHSPPSSELPVLRRRVWAGAPSLWPLPPSSGVSTAATLSAAVGETQKDQLSREDRVLAPSLPIYPQPQVHSQTRNLEEMANDGTRLFGTLKRPTWNIFLNPMNSFHKKQFPRHMIHREWPSSSPLVTGIQRF